MSLDRAWPSGDYPPVTRLVSSWVGVLFGLMSLLSSADVLGQEELAAAEALFKEGRELMLAGDAEAACRKFAESQRLDPSAGTALNLAQCYERVGRTASAWAQYLVARRIGRAQKREQVVEEATRKAAELEPRLSHLSLQISEPVDGLAVALGDTQLEPAAVGSKIPVDPGTVVVRVTAPGYRASTTEVEIPEGRDTSVVIPALLADSKPRPVDEPSRPPPDPEPLDTGSDGPDHTWAYVLGGVGVAALGTGVGLGFAAKSKNDEARELCGGGTTGCPSQTLDRSDDADSLATLGTIAGTVGLVSLAVGAVLYFTAQPANTESVAGAAKARWQLDAALGQDSAVLTLQGGF